MEYRTTTEWDESLWRQAEPVYEQSFPEHGRKNRAIIRRMFERRMCQLHTAARDGQVAAMALTGIDREAGALIVDYIAVAGQWRGLGIGREFVEYMKRWARASAGCKAVIIEAEADPTPDNAARIRFWERCGFKPTDYVHHYIWVPEPYRAMYATLEPGATLPDDGKLWFRSITKFHEKAYRGGNLQE